MGLCMLFFDRVTMWWLFSRTAGSERPEEVVAMWSAAVGKCGCCEDWCGGCIDWSDWFWGREGCCGDMDSWCMGGLLCGEGAAADMMVVRVAPAVEGCCDEGDGVATAARDSRRGCRRGISCMTEGNCEWAWETSVVTHGDSQASHDVVVVVLVLGRLDYCS
ncbi:hypothetical protein LWI29_019523 [Acer saccharum]|uniref:Uncharacterized protein n=1 Tax=Acer saccharum TaxID=4024 RepID=A0AA39SWA8_ACESA|nr:hypothetical protein LWI29_019523 [Acer saccharum]